MQENYSPLLKYITRGSLRTLHDAQMSTNVIKMIVIILLAAGILVFSTLSYFTVPNHQWKIAKSYYKANFFHSLRMDHRKINLDTPDGTFYLTPPEIIYQSPGTKRDVENLWGTFKQNILLSFLVMSLFAIAFLWQMHKKGKQQYDKNFLRGGQLVSPRELNTEIKKKHKRSKLTLGEISLIEGYETRGFLFLGAPGTGKTQAFYHLLEYAQKNKQGAFIFDAEGVFTQNFYREGKDILLNITDERSAPWSMWADCFTLLDYDEMASALIPRTNAAVSDPFWNDAARIILSVALQRMAVKGIRSTGLLLKYLTTADFNRIRELGKGTNIDSYSNDQIAKLALSIKAILSTHLNCLRFLVEGENEFSIREWVRNPKGRCVFISCPETYADTLTPLLSAWLRIACKEMLVLDENLSRRIWILADEIPVIKNISAIQDLLPRARKRGCCIAVGLQDLATLEQKHGRETAKIFSANIRTRVFYGSTDYETASWISSTLGKQEIVTNKENISYGAKENRSGNSQQESQETPQLVLPEEIMRLPDLHGYLQIVGDLPIAKIKIPLKKHKKTIPAYLPRELINLMDNTPDDEAHFLSTPETTSTIQEKEEVTEQDIINTDKPPQEVSKKSLLPEFEKS